MMLVKKYLFSNILLQMVMLNEKDIAEVSIKYYLLAVHPVSIELVEPTNSTDIELPKTYLQLKSLLELDIGAITRPINFDLCQSIDEKKRKVWSCNWYLWLGIGYFGDPKKSLKYPKSVYAVRNFRKWIYRCLFFRDTIVIALLRMSNMYHYYYLEII